MNTILIITTLSFAVLNALLFLKLKKEHAEHNSLSEKLSLVQSQLEELQAKGIADISLAEVDYFKSQKDKLMFLLLEVDGKCRNQLLGITPICTTTAKQLKNGTSRCLCKCTQTKTQVTRMLRKHLINSMSFII